MGLCLGTADGPKEIEKRQFNVGAWSELEIVGDYI